MTQQEPEKRLKNFRLIILVTSALLFILLGLFELVPLSYGSAEQYISQATMQSARSAAFAKNALLLQHDTAGQQLNALSDLQIALPLFEQEQATLLRDHDSGIQAALLDARPSYLALDTAVKALLSLDQARIDLQEVEIIVLSSRTYNVAMSNLYVILQNQANDFNFHLVGTQGIVTALIAGCFVWLYLLSRQHTRKQLMWVINMDALIAKYRSVSDLRERQYTEQTVQNHVLALASQLRLAVVAGHDTIAENIAYVLDLCEPLEDVDELHRIYLHISYLTYVQKDLTTALSTTETALSEHDDERLRKVLSVLQQTSSV